VTLAEQWTTLESGLPAGWSRARLGLAVDDPACLERAAALLGPLTPGRTGATLGFEAVSRGPGSSPAAVGRALARLDAERIRARLELLGTEDAAAAAAPPAAGSLAGAWDRLLADLPEDWSDLYAQIDLTSSDHLAPAALWLAPLNPARHEASSALRFRCARRFGYGAAPVMARRCLARLDERDIPGRISVLRVLSDTRPVGTQGPVWLVGGKVV